MTKHTTPIVPNPVGPNPSGLCLCGCGNPAPIAKYSFQRRGWIKGLPVCYIKGHNPSIDPIERFWRYANPRGESDCWEWMSTLDTKGYGRMIVKRRQVSAHRFSWELHKGSIPKGLHVCHHCDNPRCVNPTHLFLGTQQDNMDDMNRKNRGRHPLGGVHIVRPSSTYRCKLSEALVGEIRERYTQGNISMRTLAHEYGVSKSAITSVVTRRTWRHIP